MKVRQVLYFLYILSLHGAYPVNLDTSGLRHIPNPQGAGHKQFYAVQKQMNWVKARQFCASRGMTLATIDSPEEQDVLANTPQMFKDNWKFLWLGGSDEQEEGLWRWITTGADIATGFTNWYSGPPQELPSSYDKNCLLLNLKWNGEFVRWEDTYCLRTAAHPLCQNFGNAPKNGGNAGGNPNGPREVSYDLTVSYFDSAPDGVSKRVLGINNQFPGPTIRLRKHDTLKVTLHNRIQHGQNTSLHWHGLEQKHTPWEDGPEGVNQCPLVYGSTQVYRFKVEQAGTFWYHSHSSYQYTEGCWGVLIVDDVPKDTYAHRYNGELIITLNDWYHNPSKSLSEWYLSPLSQSHEPIPDSLLINGRGTYPCLMAKKKQLKCDPAVQGPALFKAHPKRTYRVRVINASTMTSFYFAIDGHTLTPIEADGVTTVIAGEVGEAFLSAAQRYSFLVTMNGGLSQYWIRARAFTENFIKNPHYPGSLPDVFLTSPSTAAVLRYIQPNPKIQKREVKVKDNLKVEQDFCPERNQTQSLRVKRNPQINYQNGQRSPQPQRKPPPDPVHVPVAKGKFPQTNAALTPAILSPDNQRILRPYDNIQAPSTYDQLVTLNILSYENEWPKFGTIHTFNGIRYHPPANSLPILHQMLRNDKISPSVNPIPIQAGKVIQVVVNNGREHGHPFHMHGHTFWVVGGGNGTYNEGRDRASLYTDGVKRDTTSMGGQAWMAIRFVADNPGTWLFHCHIHWHLEAGLGAVFIEGQNAARNMYKLPTESKNVCIRGGTDGRYLNNL